MQERTVWRREVDKAVRICLGDDWEGGLAILEQIARAEANGNLVSVPGRFYSFLGAARARAQGRWEEGFELCEKALEIDIYDAESLLNLADLAHRLGRRATAVEALLKARRLDRQNRRIPALELRIGVRKPPVFGFLSRDHFLNRWCGRLRHEIKAKRLHAA